MQFDKVAREAFGTILEPLGFSCSESQACTFYKAVSADLYHFVMPDQLHNLPKYDVKIFFHSPLLEPASWDDKFPDALGIPTESWSYLSSRSGVGPRQELFWCRTEEGFLRGFEEKVKPALLGFAVPYFDSVQTLGQAVPLIKSKHYAAVASALNA
ncbi:hypothetical protein [Marinobacter confluentis]|uniref:DUF4304 domain-containing protein n=1 Tax=Marinobacter confluentis TaxID=1697557 RepID=A0A4Z1C130_9GAMM|nr:hypothetical protein [Marinobacter confluentis]TGN38672.1 hypothetical protein E5Q11_13065 [Marinobacter confluentis]